MHHAAPGRAFLWVPTMTWYQNYLLSDWWALVRRKALQAAGFRCQLCNSPEKLQVHHRSYANIGNEKLGDLTVLCEDCHEVFHEHRNLADAVRAVENEEAFVPPPVRVESADIGRELGMAQVQSLFMWDGWTEEERDRFKAREAYLSAKLRLLEDEGRPGRGFQHISEILPDVGGAAEE